MTMPDSFTIPRRKVVWGPKRTIAALALLVLGLAANGFAAGSQNGAAPGGPSSVVKNYKLDDVVAARAAQGNPAERSSVIVTLHAGADLPPQFNVYARPGKLDIINGFVLDLPNAALNQLAAHPSVFRVHDDRDTFTH